LQTDLVQRQQGEAGIRDCRDSDSRKFIATLTREIADEENEDGIR